mgnify:CR=1 FL=1
MRIHRLHSILFHTKGIWRAPSVVAGKNQIWCAENFFKSFFHVALIHRHFTAQFLNGDGVADMLQ